MVLYIKNMVCNRCKIAVQSELEKRGIHPVSVELGEVQLDRTLSEAEKQDIFRALSDLGFEIIDDKKSRLIERVKNLIVELVHQNDGHLKTNLSEYLSSRLHHDYHYLSGLFSEVEGTTIEKYFIAQRTERVKELLVYNELSLSEIAFKMNYSSAAYLSAQFKKVTGLTPGHFKKIGGARRKPLDKV